MLHLTIDKPRLRWLFGGMGFHNSEATMTAIMKPEFYEQTVLKCFREISPTYSRVFAGYADWTKSSMDAFADYYDQTFRKAGTTLYIVPGRMPMLNDAFDMKAYCEKVADNLDYLVKVRRLTKIRYYCVTNELSCGNTYAYLSGHLETLKELHGCLYETFRRHGLDIGLLATDASGLEQFGQVQWAIENMDEVTEVYCCHLYLDAVPGDRTLYPMLLEEFSKPVAQAIAKEKRFTLGEYGINKPNKWDQPVMRNDVSYAVDCPEADGKYAIAVTEFALAALNTGCQNAVFWTMFDYPDPFLREDGDSPQEKALYDVSRFSGHGLSIRYNKNGLIRWSDEEHDYSARSSYYTLGRFARLFRKNSRVLKIEKAPEDLRFGAVTNADGSMTLCAISWREEPVEIRFDCQHTLDKPLRRYTFEAANTPHSEFNDLPKWDGLVSVEDNGFTVTLPPVSCVYLTTDYVDRTPSPVEGVRLTGGRLEWNPCEDPQHSYYRVYRNGRQFASTAVTHCNADRDGTYEVYSVDLYGNCEK